jgi:NTP pyrophosphatase (non-canonical NTP hydrolase)
MIMAPENETQLIHQVGTWSIKNFGERRAAELGICEEIGEAIHCVLKRKQRIRGFDKDEVFYENFKDALADTIIYLCDWCHIHNAFFKFGRNLQAVGNPATDERRVIVHLLQGAASMMLFEELNPMGGYKVSSGEEGAYNMVAQRICSGIEYWAQIYDVDLRVAVAITWAKVSQRDWTKNPAGPSETKGQKI